MRAKQALYAAVGAPIVAAKAVNARLDTIREQMESRSEGLTRKARELIDELATEGEQAVERLSDPRVDFDQAREQVGRLRAQLEDMLDTWRTSLRPEEAEPSAQKASTEPPSTEKATGEEKPAAEDGEQPETEEPQAS